MQSTKSSTNWPASPQKYNIFYFILCILLKKWPENKFISVCIKIFFCAKRRIGLMGQVCDSKICR